MFMLFTFSFGDDFYFAAGVLLGIELLGQFLKLVDFTSIQARFKEKDLYNDIELAQKVHAAEDLVNEKFN